MGKRTNTAKWDEKRNHWKINVQKDGERRSFYSSTPGRNGQREANAKADAWLDDNIVDQSTKVSKLWEEYLADVEASSGTSNYKQTENLGRNYILPVCGNKKIGSLNEGHLQDVLNKAYKSGSLNPDSKKRENVSPLSKVTLQNIRGVSTRFIKWCRKHKYTTLHPEELTIPTGARKKGKKILQPDALRILCAHDTTVKYRKQIFDDLIYAFRFAVFTGMRPGEIIGLKVGDVVGRKVNINRAINVYNEQTQGKNGNAIRTFELNDYAYEAYQNQLKLLQDSGVKVTDEIPLFPVSNEQYLYTRWLRFQTAHNIEPHISLYELRHTFVSIAQNLPDSKLKPLVGHSRSMDTRGVYAHHVEGSEEGTASELSKQIKEILEKKSTA